MRYSVLVLTKNEEVNLGGCLASVREDVRIVVLDSGSEDGTQAIARADPRVQWLEHPFASFADQRNHGLRNFFEKDEWVLHLDADERLTPALNREIKRLPDDKASAYNLAPMTYMRGRRIPRASGYPVYQTRLTRVGHFEFVTVGHGQKAPNGCGPLRCLKHPYEHHPFEKGLIDWIARHDRYAALEASDMVQNGHYASLFQALCDPIARRQWIKRWSKAIPLRPKLIYLYLMYIQGGVFDGPEGRDYCRLRGLYETLIDLKMRQLRGQEEVAQSP